MTIALNTKTLHAMVNGFCMRGASLTIHAEGHRPSHNASIFNGEDRETHAYIVHILPNLQLKEDPAFTPRNDGRL